MAPLLSSSLFSDNKKDGCKSNRLFYGAGDEARTRYLHLGKVALYRMSYTRRNKRYYSNIFGNVNRLFEKIPGK